MASRFQPSRNDREIIELDHLVVEHVTLCLPGRHMTLD
jgi:hypothetical protein